MDWLRMYHEARTDAKLRLLSDSEFRVWFNLLLFSSEQENRGEIDADNRFLLAAEVSGGDEQLLADTLTKLAKLDIIKDHGDCVQFVHFGKRQYTKPSDEPEAVRKRVREHRERKRNAETEEENACNAECNAPVTPGNALDTDTDTDKTKGMCVPPEAEPHDAADESAEDPEPDEPTPQAKRNAYPEDFERFWQAYPPNRRLGKKAAYKAWQAQQKRKRDERAPPGALIAAAERYADECERKGTEASYIMHPKTFLGPRDPYEDYLGDTGAGQAAAAFDDDPDEVMARLRERYGELDADTEGGEHIA